MKLEAPYEKGIIHRDLKPGNITITLDGFVKELDFGLAEALQETQTEDDVAEAPTGSTCLGLQVNGGVSH